MLISLTATRGARAAAPPSVRPLASLDYVVEQRLLWGMVGEWKILAAAALDGIAMARASGLECVATCPATL
eukprot:6201693-Pleurochrysis_carterae.AAC.8